MNKMMTKPVAMLALLLATSTAFSQVPVLKKPILAPQLKPVIKPSRPIDSAGMLSPFVIAKGSPDHREAARRLKAHNIPDAPALGAIRGAFGGLRLYEEIGALRDAGYGGAALAVAYKELDRLEPRTLLSLLPMLGVPKENLAAVMRSSYSLDFDALLAVLRNGRPYGSLQSFGFALKEMDFTPEQMVQTGYRYFSGGFPSEVEGNGNAPYPRAGQMYRLLKQDAPLVESVRVEHYALFQMLLNAGYPPEQVLAEVSMGIYTPSGVTNDVISRCILYSQERNSSRQTARADSPVNPLLVVHMSPAGEASYSVERLGCFAKFLSMLRSHGARRDVAGVLADNSVTCMPLTNPACPVQRAEAVERMLQEAGFGS